MAISTPLRLAPTACTAWITALICIHAPEVAWALGVSLWLAALLVTAIIIVPGRREDARRTSIAAVIAIVALGAGAAAASHVALAQPAREAVASIAADGRDAVVQARVVGKVERRGDGSLAFDAAATRIDLGATRRTLEAAVTIRVAPEDVAGRRDLDVGADIEARGAIARSWPGEREVLEIRAARGVTVLRPPQGLTGAAATLRQGLVEATAGLAGEGAGLVPGLAVGDTSVVSVELDAAMKESSLSHLTAVSGANCALVVGIAFVVAAALGASRAVRVGSGLVALAGFVVLVTPEPSVARAAAMAAIAMISVLLGRLAAGVAALSVSVAVLLVMDPWLAGSLGFALSVAATGSLLLFAAPIARGLARIMPRGLALSLAVPLSAQLACAPLLVLITPHVSVYGVLANLVASPAAPVGTLLGLASCLAIPVPPLQEGLAALAWVPATWIAATATTFADLPGDLIPWPEGWAGVASLAAVSTAVGVSIAIRGTTLARRVARAASVATVCIVVGTTAGGGLLSGGAGRWTLPAAWSILACDVGQGDALLLRSGGAVAVVDTGPAPESLAACLDRAGVDGIDLLVLTHFDLDHVGGIPAVEGRVGMVLHGPAAPEDAAVLDRLAASGSRVVEASRGLRGSLGDARWRVLWPVSNDRAFPPGNDASVVLDVRGGGVPPALLLGDLSAPPQRALQAAGAIEPPYAVVKVAHHGSADQEPRLYMAAAAAVAIISVGADNDYGHPREEILQVLAGSGGVIARTDRDGVIALSPTRDGVEVWRERGG